MFSRLMKVNGDHSYQAKFPVNNTLNFSNKWLQNTWNGIQESCGLVNFLVPIHSQGAA